MRLAIAWRNGLDHKAKSVPRYRTRLAGAGDVVTIRVRFDVGFSAPLVGGSGAFLTYMLSGNKGAGLAFQVPEKYAAKN